MKLRLSELLQCMYIANHEVRRSRDLEDDSTIEIPMPFSWNGKKGEMVLLDGYEGYYNRQCKITIDDKVILAPLTSMADYKYRFSKPVDVIMTQESVADCDDYAFPLAVYLMVTDIFTAEEIKDKIIFTEPFEGKTSAKVSNKDGHLSKIIINTNFEDEGWAGQLQNAAIRNSEKTRELYEIAKHMDSLFEFLNSVKLEVSNHDCYSLLPKDLYLVDDYTFEEYISSGDYLILGDPIDDTDLGKAEKERQAALDWIDSESKFHHEKREGEVTAQELLTHYKTQTLNYIRNELEENEEVYDRLDSLSDELEEVPEDVIPYLFEDFWDEVEKYLQKDLKKFPYQVELKGPGDNANAYLEYLKNHGKRLGVYIEDLEDAILELDIDDIVE